MTLRGKRILLGRQPGTGSAVEQRLRQFGANVSSVPLIEVYPLEAAEIDKAFDGAKQPPDFVVITSKNAMAGYAYLRTKIPPHRLAVVGQRTATACRQRGYEPDLCGNGKGALALLQLMAEKYALSGTHILYPCSTLVTDEFSRAAKALEATVQMVPVYRTEPPPRLAAQDVADYDAAVFFSSSGAENFHAVKPFSTVTKMAAVAMGEQTANTLRQLGAHHVIVAADPNTDALFEAVVKSVSAKNPQEVGESR